MKAVSHFHQRVMNPVPRQNTGHAENGAKWERELKMNPAVKVKFKVTEL